jgi:hypothetical protein
MAIEDNTRECVARRPSLMQGRSMLSNRRRTILVSLEPASEDYVITARCRRRTLREAPSLKLRLRPFASRGPSRHRSLRIRAVSTTRQDSLARRSPYPEGP